MNLERRLNLLRKNIRNSSTDVVKKLTVAEGEQLPCAILDHNWSNGSELTLKRTGGKMQFFVNDKFITEFSTPVFPIKGLSIGTAHESKVEITSIEFHTRS